MFRRVCGIRWSNGFTTTMPHIRSSVYYPVINWIRDRTIFKFRALKIIWSTFLSYMHFNIRRILRAQKLCKSSVRPPLEKHKSATVIVWVAIISRYVAVNWLSFRRWNCLMLWKYALSLMHVQKEDFEAWIIPAEIGCCGSALSVFRQWVSI